MMTTSQREQALATRAANMEALKPRNRPECDQLLATLQAQAPSLYRGLVDQLANGSKAAAIKLHCLQCVGYERAEVARCSSRCCPLWPFRPYQGSPRGCVGNSEALCAQSRPQATATGIDATD